MQNRSFTNQAGFTLVELIVVIIILAILGAVALPKFIDVTEKAQVSAVKGAGGGLGAGVALFHAQWVANGHTAAVANVAGFGGAGATATVDANAAGWPVGTDGTSMDADADCAAVWNNVMQGPPTLAASAGGVEYVYSRSTTTCTYTYYGGQSTAPSVDTDGDSTAGNMTIAYNSANGSVVVTIP